MKRFLLFFTLIGLLFSVSSCFKPDGSLSEKENLLLGYWEVSHITDEDVIYYTDENGTEQVFDSYSFDEDIKANDGNEEYFVLNFSEVTVTLIATDIPDMAELLNIPLAYTQENNKLYGMIFNNEYCEYTLIKSLDKNNLVILASEQDTYTENGITYRLDFKRTTTFKRINN